MRNLRFAVGAAVRAAQSFENVRNGDVGRVVRVYDMDYPVGDPREPRHYDVQFGAGLFTIPGRLLVDGGYRPVPQCDPTEPYSKALDAARRRQARAEERARKAEHALRAARARLRRRLGPARDDRRDPPRSRAPGGGTRRAARRPRGRRA